MEAKFGNGRPPPRRENPTSRELADSFTYLIDRTRVEVVGGEDAPLGSRGYGAQLPLRHDY